MCMGVIDLVIQLTFMIFPDIFHMLNALLKLPEIVFQLSNFLSMFTIQGFKLPILPPSQLHLCSNHSQLSFKIQHNLD